MAGGARTGIGPLAATWGRVTQEAARTQGGEGACYRVTPAHHELSDSLRWSQAQHLMDKSWAPSGSELQFLCVRRELPFLNSPRRRGAFLFTPFSDIQWDCPILRKGSVFTWNARLVSADAQETDWEELSDGGAPSRVRCSES